MLFIVNFYLVQLCISIILYIVYCTLFALFFAVEFLSAEIRKYGLKTAHSNGAT